MKKVLFGAMAAIAMASSAQAADIVPAPRQTYAKSPAMVAAVNNWSGFYLGVMGGYARENSSGSGTLSGGFAGGTLGYNWQSGPMVFGLEADAAWSNIGATVGNPAFLALTARVRDLGTARARIGYAFNQVMIYGTGGYAWIDNRFTFTLAGLSVSDTRFHSGWTAGAGVEVMFAPKWSVKAEYLYRSLANQNYFRAQVPGGLESGTLNLNSVQVGVNYHF